MPNNPLNPPPDPKPVKEVPTATNSFTETMRGADPHAVDEVTQQTTGKKLTREEQLQFINELPDDLMMVFAQRVRATMDQEKEQTQTRKKPEYVNDFSTLHENSVFDLNVPIQAIDHQIPEYLRIKLKDSNFDARWIQTSSKRLGQARSQGWAYISKEDLLEDLGVEIEADASGHFVYIDTVAMKIPKSKLFTQLRSNYLRAIALTQQSKLHEQMKATIESEISKALDPETGIPLHNSFVKYRDDNKMNVYSPLAK